MTQRILFLCEGNICRSPMAEAMLKAVLPDRTVSSAGLNALVGMPPADYACEVMSTRGISIQAHRAQQISHKMFVDADLVLVMDSHQRRYVEANFPSFKGRVYRLGEFGRFDVADPYRQSRDVFEQCANSIQVGVSEWVKRILSIG
ncbi:low molecular weight protein-tyrosine-phosphatase [Paraburkholderia phytofirmans]|uniref:low molecular weight protein-tyrosine-phosphatase n=1 Tax=Paraburkholderia phytofirmans TaxID=261302 RepID=UPI0038BBD671